MILTALGLATAAAFAGAATYINLSEHPARMSLDDASALKAWKPSYAKGLEMQATLAIVSGLLGFAAFYFEHQTVAALGGALMLANWPYTLLVMTKTNKALVATADSDAGTASHALLVKWGRLHAVRTFLGILAACAYIFAGAGQ